MLPTAELQGLVMELSTFVEHEVNHEEETGVDPEEESYAECAIRVEIYFFLNDELDGQKADEVRRLEAVENYRYTWTFSLLLMIWYSSLVGDKYRCGLNQPNTQKCKMALSVVMDLGLTGKIDRRRSRWSSCKTA